MGNVCWRLEAFLYSLLVSAVIIKYTSEAAMEQVANRAMHNHSHHPLNPCGNKGTSSMNQHPTDPKASQSGSTALRFDMVAGLTAAAVVLPKAMAYATVAGLPVAVGLYTAFIPMVIYALLGSSRVLSVSSTTTLAILAGTQLGLVVPDGDPAKPAEAPAATIGAKPERAP